MGLRSFPPAEASGIRGAPRSADVRTIGNFPAWRKSSCESELFRASPAVQGRTKLVAALVVAAAVLASGCSTPVPDGRDRGPAQSPGPTRAGGHDDATDESRGFVDWADACPNEPPSFPHSPVNVSQLRGFIPLGNLAPPSHVFPTRHTYFQIQYTKPGDHDSPTIQVPVVAPTDLWATRLKWSQRTHPQFGESNDYELRFVVCRELVGYFDHLHELSGRLAEAFGPPYEFCHDYTTHDYDTHLCEKSLQVRFSAGERLGSAGGGTWQDQGTNLDFGMADSRVTLSWGNPARWADVELQSNIVCPIQFFPKSVRSALEALMIGPDGTRKAKEPLCGTIAQDAPGMAQGVWFVEGTVQTFPEDPHLALVHDNYDPDMGIFSVGRGAEAYGVAVGAYRFAPSHAGFVNRDFDEVGADAQVYCYENLSSSNTREDYSNLVLLVQMPTDGALRLSKKRESACGDPPFGLSSSYAEYER